MDAWAAKWKVKIRYRLGAGTFGKVYAGFDQNTRAVAIKIQEHDDESSVADFKTEITSLEAMKRNPHPNIICLYDYLLDTMSRTSGIAMELAAMDLRKLLTSQSHRLKPDLAQSFGRQMVFGVAHLHRHGIIHRDIKPQNLLVCFTSMAPTLKIGDFGSLKATPFRGGMTGNMVTCWYRPPEVFSRCQAVRIQYGTPVDVWSMGCVLWELCLWSIAFGGESEELTAAMIVHRLGQPQTWPPGFPDKALFPKEPQVGRTLVEVQELTGRPDDLDSGVDLLRKCLNWLPEERLSAEQCCKHPFCEEPSSAGQDPADPVCHSERRTVVEHHPGLIPASSSGSGASRQPVQQGRPAPSTAALDPNGGQPDITPQCKCLGHCPGGHRRGVPCTGQLPSTPAHPLGHSFCTSCRCSSPECIGARFRSPFCFHHAYENLSIEFRAIRHLQLTNIMQRMMPLSVQAFLDASSTVPNDLALELIFAWFNEPLAIEALIAHRPTSKHYTGAVLLTILKRVCRP